MEMGAPDIGEDVGRLHLEGLTLIGDHLAQVVPPEVACAAIALGAAVVGGVVDGVIEIIHGACVAVSVAPARSALDAQDIGVGKTRIRRQSPVEGVDGSGAIGTLQPLSLLEMPPRRRLVVSRLVVPRLAALCGRVALGEPFDICEYAAELGIVGHHITAHRDLHEFGPVGDLV